MTSQALSHIPWLIYSLVVAAMTIWSTILFFRDRCAATRLMLIGGIIAAIFGTSFQFAWRSIILFYPSAPGSFYQLTSQILSPLAALGNLLFHIGLLLFAKRLLNRSDRVAQLEAILQDRDAQSPT